MIKHKGIDVAKTVIHHRNGAFIDVTKRLTAQPVVSQVVNNETKVTFSIINDTIDQKSNLLSKWCERWTDNHKGAVSKGDIVTVDYYNEGLGIPQTRLARGRIATIVCNGDILDFTVVDVIAELKKVGATYFRNHYKEKSNVTRPFSVKEDEGAQQNKFYVDKGGETAIFNEGYVKFAKNDAVTSAINSNVAYNKFEIQGQNEFIEFTYPINSYALTSLKIYMAAINPNLPIVVDNIRSYKIEVRKNNASGEVIGTETGSFTQILNQNCEIPVKINIVTGISSIYIKVTNLSQPYNFVLATPPRSIAILGNTQNSTGRVRKNGGSWMNGSIGLNAGTANLCNVVGVTPEPNQTLYGNSIYRIGHIIVNNQTYHLTPGDLEPKFNRAIVEYRPDAETISSLMVMNDILKANGYALTERININTSSAEISEIRCGGDFIHNYLLAMADLEKENGGWKGHQSVIAADTRNDKSIILSRRMDLPKNKNDPNDINAPRFRISYAGDKLNDGSIWLMSFSPVTTMANQPVTSFIQGQTKDGIPIMVAVTDRKRMDEQGGVDLSSISFDSNASGIIDAAKGAYADVIQYVNKKWEGTLQLSGIHNAFINIIKKGGGHIGFIDLDHTSETYGSGVPISVTDSRYGMENEILMVKEVVYDFRELITKITLSNYSLPNSNVLIENTKMALRAGNMATDVMNNNLFLRQYLLERMDGPPLQTQTNTVTIRLTNNTNITVPATTLVFPALKMTVLSAHFLPGPDVSQSVLDHGVRWIRYNSVAFKEIDKECRPDKMLGQSLTVNIQVQHP